ncbi:DUF3105 domain-containing protein [Nocardioides guangzhouensis]|uniref:DUF3105 domain-containing protein n=1 Tax=Nocardioides guangzhouensis TaxID=2497878 RepID=A0A4Q4ZFU3_9ACTN|nr:DUF3105 domain-containing protein [Nocardioides guangzhouensis]RYP87022.1 DUF3105 domain-containing protein [Nocardioides guangzhouensis]
MSRQRLGLLLAVLAAVAVVALALAVPRLGDDDEDPATSAQGGDASGSAAGTEEPDPTSGLDQVRQYDVGEVVHTEDQVSYTQAPPVGGDHANEWLQCGRYDEPVREENMVHSLEHGTVWITYRPGLPAADLRALADVLPAKGVLSPYADQSAPVVVTVWNTQLRLAGADDQRLDEFVATYGDGGTSPEPFASCEGGGERLESEDG